MRERKSYSIAPRTCDNVGCDIILTYAHRSILNSNVEEVDKQPENHCRQDIKSIKSIFKQCL